MPCAAVSPRCDRAGTPQIRSESFQIKEKETKFGEGMMTSLHRIHACLVVSSLLVLFQVHGFAQESDVSKSGSQPAITQRDGQHDFDFEFGTWKTHLRRLQDPLTGSTNWAEYDGTTVVHKIWDGRANLIELEADGPAGHFEGLSLRLYNPQAHQWSLNFASSSGGALTQPTIGEFKNGRGEFYDQETLNGRAIFVRFVISDMTPNSCRFEQAFSDDGGKTWEVNWIATDTRVSDESAVKASLDQSGVQQHDFDFELGNWKIHLKRLAQRLTGSHTWVEFDGTSVTRKVWNGRSQIEEFETDSPAGGHIEGLTLRLYNPQTHQWGLYWATSKNGVVGLPTIGEFKNGRGEFFDTEPSGPDGRAILVRFIWSEITSNSAHFEQSFSDDGGKTWEVNWITDQTRVEGLSGKMN
jgi:hypothetical protein